MDIYFWREILDKTEIKGKSYQNAHREGREERKSQIQTNKTENKKKAIKMHIGN